MNNQLKNSKNPKNIKRKESNLTKNTIIKRFRRSSVENIDLFDFPGVDQ